jgi:8-hydroxy-5-deazaflavin:NADPH oxidoreductase
MIESLGVIGTGAVGQAVARHAAGNGVTVVLSNSRGPGSIADLAAEMGDAVSAATVKVAAAAEMVLLAVPFSTVAQVAAEVGDWNGRVVIDATNQFASRDPYDGRAELGEETGSEYVARHLPGATVIKAFNAMFAAYIQADPRHRAGRQVVFYAGDDAAANARFSELIEGFGFAAVHVGSLREGGRLMQLDGHLSGLHVLRQN